MSGVRQSAHPALDSFAADLRAMIREIVREEIAAIRAELAASGEYVTTSTAATVASVVPATIRRWVREGILEAYGSGKKLRVQRAALDRLIRLGPPRPDDHLTPAQRAARDFG